MENEKWVFDPKLNEETKSVVRIKIGEVDWYMEWDDWEKARVEGRTRPVIYLEKLIFVDDETADELGKLEEWLKIKGEL